MTSHYRHRRFYDPATVFPAVEPGEITVNSANRQLGLGDADPASPGVVKPLIAIRYFDIKAQYAIGDMIGRTGHVWRAKVVISPGPYDPAEWELAAVDASYVDAGDAGLQTQIDGKVNRSGDTMEGRLFLAFWPAEDYEATTKGYVDQIVAQGGPFHLRADQITYAPSGSLESTDVQAAITELMTEKAEINSPNFVGNPTAPTRLSNDNDDSIATTFFVHRAVDIGKISPVFTGDPQAPTPPPGDSDNSLATTEFVMEALKKVLTTGDVKLTLKVVADPGWVMMNDTHIGNPSSGAFYASAECHALFLLMYANIPDAYCPVSGGRSGNAEADWSANKYMLLPKVLGRALAAAGSGSGLTGRGFGGKVGEEAHTLTIAEQANMPMSVVVDTSVSVSVTVPVTVSVTGTADVTGAGMAIGSPPTLQAGAGSSETGGFVYWPNWQPPVEGSPPVSAPVAGTGSGSGTGTGTGGSSGTYTAALTTAAGKRTTTCSRRRS